MTDPVQLIAESVRSRARRGDLVAGADDAIAQELQRYAERAFAADVPLIADESAARRRVAAELTGLGPLQPLLDDPGVEEIWINGPNARN